jgi:hypothetical protein
VAFWKYIGSSSQAFPEHDIVANPNEVYSFGSEGPPAAPSANSTDRLGALPLASTLWVSDPGPATAQAGVSLPDLSKTYALVVGLGASNGTDDTAAVNTILAGAAGKIVKGKHGENYLISGTLIVPSGCTLDMTNCTVTMSNSATGNMVNNKAMTSVATGTDGAMTSGSNILTTAVTASVGQTVTVSGATLGGYILVGLVSAVGGGTITLTDLSGGALNAGATVSGATVTVYNRDSNITLRGGTWNRGTAGPASGGRTAFSLRFEGVDGLIIRDMTIKSGNAKEFIAPANSTNVLVENIVCSVFSSPFQGQGPLKNVTVRNLYGTCGDDVVAFTPNDWPGYNTTVGDIVDVVVDNINVNSSAANGVKFLGGSPGTKILRAKATRIFGTVLLHAVWIGDDAAQASTTGGFCDDITVENVSAKAGSGYDYIYINGTNMGRVRVKGVAFDNSSQTLHLVEYAPASAATMPQLIVEDVQVKSMGAAGVVSVGQNAILSHLICNKIEVSSVVSGMSGIIVSGTVTDLTLNNFSGTLTGSAYVLALNGAVSAATVTRATLSGIHVNGGGGLFSSTGNTAVFPNLEASGCTLNGTAWLFDLGSTTEVHLSGVTLIGPTQGIANIRATGVVTVGGSGNALAAGSQNWKVTAGGKCSVRVFDAPAGTTAGGFPTIAAGAGAGGSPTVTVAGTDRAGTVTVVVGSSPAAGVLATVTFAGTWPQAVKVALTPTLTAASYSANAYVSSKTTTTFVISTVAVPSGTVTFDYAVTA